MDDLTSTVGLVALGAAAAALIALVLVAVCLRTLRRLRAEQRVVLGEHGQEDLVAHAAALSADFAQLRAGLEGHARGLEDRLGVAERRLDGAVARRALIRYDAYNEMSGRQSTTLALLDAVGSGVLLTSIHHRDQARMYVKEVVEGQSDVRLSPEEEEAVRIASDRVEPAA